MLFLKEHLQLHYNWTNDAGNSKYTGEPGRRLFDRLNGNQVLFIINFFAQSLGKLSLIEGHHIEDLIVKQLPADIKSELSVFNWLRGVYLYYGN